MGSSNENSAFGPVLNPGIAAASPAAPPAAARRRSRPAWRRGRSAPTPAARSASRPRSAGIVGLKPTYGACSRYGMIAFASSLDQAGPLTRDVTDAALLLRAHGGPGPARLDLAGVPRARSRCPAREDLKGVRLGVPEELLGARAADRARRARELRGGAGAGRGARGEVEPCRLPHAQHALSAYYVIAPAEASSNLARFDGVRYGLRVAGDGDLTTMYRRPAPQGFGPEVKRRIMLGTYALSSGYYDAYYGTAQKVRTRIAEDFTSGLRRGRLRRHADLARGRVRARREDRRPAGDVPERLLHGADDAGRDPGDLDPVRAQRRPAGRLPDRRARVQPRSGCWRPRYALERATRLRRQPRPELEAGASDVSDDRVRAGDRARDPRPAGDADEDVLRLRAVLRRRAEHPHLPGLPRPARARCRCSTSRRSTSG